MSARSSPRCTAAHRRSASSRTLHAARTGGNPFFLEELLSAAGELDPDQLVLQPLPWNLGEIVAPRSSKISSWPSGASSRRPRCSGGA